MNIFIIKNPKRLLFVTVDQIVQKKIRTSKNIWNTKQNVKRCPSRQSLFSSRFFVFVCFWVGVWLVCCRKHTRFCFFFVLITMAPTDQEMEDVSKEEKEEVTQEEEGGEEVSDDKGKEKEDEEMVGGGSEERLEVGALCFFFFSERKSFLSLSSFLLFPLLISLSPSFITMKSPKKKGLVGRL